MKMTGCEQVPVCAGRTDSGVHALNQVMHWDLPAHLTHSARAWIFGLNAHLRDIRLTWARRVPGHFHARFTALDRTYAYLILNVDCVPVFHAGRVAWERRPLDVDSMQQAANFLLGTHDFSAFQAAGCSAATSYRTLKTIQIEQRGSLIRITLCANAFLQRMVRIITGCLWQVGLGKWQADKIRSILHSKDRKQAAATAAAEGLYFLGPRYPMEFGLPPSPDGHILLA